MNIETLKLGFLNYLQGLNESSEKEYAVNNSDVSIFMYASEFKSYIQEELNVSGNILSMSINDILDMDIENGKLVEKENEKDTNTKTNNKTENEQTAQTNSAEATTIQPESNTEPSTQDIPTENLQDGSATGEAVAIVPPMLDITGEDTNIITPTENANGEEELSIQPDETIITDILNELFQEDDVINALDTDKNGELNEEEITTFLNTIKELDGNNQDISLDDIFGSIEAIKNDELNLGLEENLNNSKS